MRNVVLSAFPLPDLFPHFSHWSYALYYSACVFSHASQLVLLLARRMRDLCVYWIK